jgi:glycerophosphoryl diester phosphodiesterase
VRQKADAIELDAKITADGYVVVFHDQTLERTTGAKGRLIDSKLTELRKLDAGSHFDVAYRGEPIPTLDEVFELVGRQTFINVDLTNYASPFDSLPEKVAEVVMNHRLSDRVMFSSFSPVALLRIRRALPQTPIGLLALPAGRGFLARSWLGYLMRYQSLNPELSDANRGLVDRIHKRGNKVLVYTVNQPEDMRRLFDMRADGIITDDPLTARRVLSTGSEHRLKDKER